MEKHRIKPYHDRDKWKIYKVNGMDTLFFTEAGSVVDHTKLNNAWLFCENMAETVIVRQVATDEFIILSKDSDYHFDHIKMASNYDCVHLRHYQCDSAPLQVTDELFIIPWSDTRERLYSSRYRNTVENLVANEIEDAVMTDPLKVFTTVQASHIEVILTGPVEIKFQIQHEYTGIESLEPITKCYSTLRKRFINVTKLEDVNRIIQEDSEEMINAKQFVSEGGYYVDGKKVKDAMHYASSYTTAQEIWKNVAKEEVLRENNLAEIVDHELFAINFYDKVDCDERYVFYVNTNRVLILENLGDNRMKSYIYEHINPSCKCRGAKQINGSGAFVIIVEHDSGGWSLEQIEIRSDTIWVNDSVNLDSLNCMDEEGIIFTPIGRYDITKGLIDKRHAAAIEDDMELEIKEDIMEEIDRILVRNLDEEEDRTYYLSVRYGKGEGEDNYIFYMANLEQTEKEYSKDPKGFNYYNKSFFKLDKGFKKKVISKNEEWIEVANEHLGKIPT